MDGDTFDKLTRTLGGPHSRRGVLLGSGMISGLIAILIPGIGQAKKNRKKPKKNAFGCLDIGKKCNGKDSKCCSGICQGKRPRKGERDKSECKAHHTGPCQASQDSCEQGEIQCGTSEIDAICLRTTGKASFCGLDDGGDCRVCTKDTDCETLSGPGAACVVCDDCVATGGTACYVPGV